MPKYAAKNSTTKKPKKEVEEEKINISVDESITEEGLEKAKDMKEKYKEKHDVGEEEADDEGYKIGKVSGKSFTLGELSEDEITKIINCTNKELDKTEDDLSEILSSYVKVKKGYLDNETNPDPFYVDYNLLYSNVDLQMALQYSNEMKVVFTGTKEADIGNSDIITQTAEYDYREEMGMDLLEYELGMDKNLGGLGVVFWDGWNEYTNSPVPAVAPIEFYRPDPLGRGHADKYRRHGCYGKMTKQQMRDIGNFFNIDQVIGTDRDDDRTNANSDNGSNVNITADQADDESAYFVVYNHMRTMDDGRKCLVTLANGGSLLIRYVIMDYRIGGKPVFPLSMDFWKPKKGFPMGIRPYDISHRKQRVLSLLLNLAVKQTVRSSLGNHIIADGKAIKNKTQLAQLTEFPEVIIVDTDGGKKNLNNIVAELQRSSVPSDNPNLDQRIKQVNYEETSIGPNQLGQSPDGDQTAREVTQNQVNANVRLSLTNKISMIFQKDFWRKWLMMYEYHFPEDGEKQVVISREFGDKYLTFKHKYLKFSGDPHLKIVSKAEFETQSRKIFANHVVLHAYIEKLAAQSYVPLEVRLSMRKLLRLIGYPEDEIMRYVRESFEEMDAKSNLLMLNNGEKLTPLTSDDIDEHHEDYLEVYKQAKENPATRLAVMDRLRMLRERKKKDRLAEKQQILDNASGNTNTNGMQNQMTADMLSKSNDVGANLQDIQF